MMIACAAQGGRDVTPDAVDWADIFFTAPGADTNADQTIQGISEPITLGFSESGGAPNTTFSYIKNSGSPVTITFDSTTVSMSSGDTLHFGAAAGTGGDNFTVSVRNETDGDTTLDTFNVSVS